MLLFPRRVFGSSMACRIRVALAFKTNHRLPAGWSPELPRIPLCVPGPLHPCILDEGFWIQPYLVLEPKAKIGVATIGSFVQGVMTLVVGIGQIDAFFPQPGTGLLHSWPLCTGESKIDGPFRDLVCRSRAWIGSPHHAVPRRINNPRQSHGFVR